MEPGRAISRFFTQIIWTLRNVEGILVAKIIFCVHTFRRLQFLVMLLHSIIEHQVLNVHILWKPTFHDGFSFSTDGLMAHVRVQSADFRGCLVTHILGSFPD